MEQPNLLKLIPRFAELLFAGAVAAGLFLLFVNCAVIWVYGSVIYSEPNVFIAFSELLLSVYAVGYGLYRVIAHYWRVWH